MITERRSGMWNRSIAAGVKPFHLLLSHIIVGFSASLVQSIEVFGVFQSFQRVALVDSIFSMALLMVLNGFAGVACGILVSSCTDSFFVSLNIILFFFLTSVSLSGKKIMNSKRKKLFKFHSLKEEFGRYKLFHFFWEIFVNCYRTLLQQTRCWKLRSKISIWITFMFAETLLYFLLGL